MMHFSRNFLTNIIIFFAITFQLVSGKYFWQAESDIAIERKVSLQTNPGCNITACRNLTIVYARAEGPEDVIHHVWSFEGVPTIFYTRTNLKAELTIDWNLFLSGNRSSSFQFSEKPDYFAAVCLTKMIEFNDANDTGLVPDDPEFQQLTSFNPENLQWQLIKGLATTENETSATAVFRAVAFNGTGLQPPTNFQITLSACGKRQRSPSLPHLMHTENSTQIDIVMDHVETVHSYPNARLAVELVTIVLENDPASNFSVDETKSLDDEYTPGVFKLVQMLSPLKNHFLQWRPIAYTSVLRDISDSTGVGRSLLKPLIDLHTRLNDSLVSWITPDLATMAVSSAAVNITFGSPGDGFYKASNYTAWTSVMGYGSPAGDELSGMVLLVVAAGLGLPALLILSGGIWVCARQFRKRPDDLLLSG